MKLKSVGWVLMTSLAITQFIAPTMAAEKAERAAYYRYVNAQGVKVMSHSIPPEFSQQGYEVLSESGRVIKVVPPALTAADIQAVEERNQLLEEYGQLARRYSSTQNIEEAKIRQLDRLDANISITRGNINNLKRQIDGLTSKAADFERAAKPIPTNVLDSLKKTQNELVVAENLMATRQAEKQQVIDRFEHEKVMFEKGAKLTQERGLEIPGAKPALKP